MQAATALAAPENVHAFIQKYFDVWKGIDEDKILAYYSDDVVKEKQPCEITLSGRLWPRSRAMYIPFGIWLMPGTWPRWNGILKPCTKEPLPASKLLAKGFKSPAARSTNTTSQR